MSLKYERVTFTKSPNGTFVPVIGTSSSPDKSDEVVRPFHNLDTSRVLDFDNMPELPSDCTMLHCEGSVPGVVFPRRHIAMRGGFIFYFDEKDMDESGGNGPLPLGVIPLGRCDVEFPPGGRRVFREHAHTDARSGYEMMIKHRGDEGEGAENSRPLAFLVSESLGERHLWAAAIRTRSEVYRKDTKLRPTSAGGGGGISNSGTGVARESGGTVHVTNPFTDDVSSSKPGRTPADPMTSGGGTGVAPPVGRRKLRRAPKPTAQGMNRDDLAGADRKENKIVTVDGVEVNSSALGVSGEEADNVHAALKQFGRGSFEKDKWVGLFFSAHNEFDAPNMCQTLEEWQNALKKGLSGAVLEQYEYFVEASKEMTTMGREVTALRNLVEAQRETIEAMKNIDFAAAFQDPVADDYGYSSDEEEEESVEGKEDGSDISSVPSSHSDSTGWSQDGKGRSSKLPSSSTKELGARRQSKVRGDDDVRSTKKTQVEAGGHDIDNEIEEGEGGTLIEIPEWLGDVTEEISAFINQCRYSDATDLILKAKTQVNEILNQHNKLTEKRLSKKQQANMQRILNYVEGLTDRLGNRLAEGLRHKNEALKLAAKRERADPLSVLAPLVSPICLNDDSTSLQLLVKIGRPQDAATAYAARRSLLLMECLHERPISSTGASGTMDVVIYAAQLSQSFFTCLAMAVEGFLDLFLDNYSAAGGGMGRDDSDQEEMSSLHSAVGRKVPAGAIAAIVLWCDSELSKFAAAFGGTRVLGNLALSAPVERDPNSGADIAREAQISDARSRLREAEDSKLHAMAATMRQKLADLEKEEKENGGRHVGRRTSGDERTPKATAVDSKERLAAIDIATKCVDQAFQFASENLDSIGLPLTPRLAEYIRARLKNCEGEIAGNLEGRWDHVTFDWSNDEGSDNSEEEPHRTRISDLRETVEG